MAVEHPHSKLIAAAAARTLKPMGLFRKGRSRIWLDDNAWWVGVVEFQPSSFGRGSYLNVGACFLWTPKSYLSFDFGDRVDLGQGGEYVQYFQYEDDEQFAPLATRLARRAAARIGELRSLFPAFEAAAPVLAEAEPILQRIDAGIAYGLAGDAEAARAQFDRYLARRPSSYDTAVAAERIERVQRLRRLVADPIAFQTQIASDLDDARARNRLPERDVFQSGRSASSRSKEDPYSTTDADGLRQCAAMHLERGGA